MKIVILASLAFSLTNFRGRLLRELAERGHEVIACAPDKDPAVIAELKRMGIAFRVIPMARVGLNPLQDAGTLLALVRLIRAERPGLVLAYTQKPIVYGGLAARLVPGTRYCAMMSGLGYAFGPQCGRLVRNLVAVLYRLALARAEAVLVFNSDDEAEMRRHGMLRRDARVVQVPGSGVDLARHQETALPAGLLHVVMIARLLRSKGVADFVEAARIVRTTNPEVRFTLVGPSDPSPDGMPVDEIEAWAREGAVHYAGAVRDVRPSLRAASVFVLPSWYREGLPRTILEAMATGRAVVTTDMPGCREPIEPGRNGFLVPPRDPAALAAALMRFVDDPELAAVMGRAARDTASRRFAVEIVNDLVLSTLRLSAGARRQERIAGPAPVAAAVR